MDRRTFLLGSIAGVGAITLASCTSQPEPSPTPTPPTTPDPTSDVPAPTAFRRSRWSTDPFARGAFSFDAVGATPELREALAEPVLDRVFFAGEATSASAPGTLEGAWESGLRAARQVAVRTSTDERIAIIGAGVAGLTAARRLAEEGYDAVVIEARPRLGGRIDGEVIASLELAPGSTGMIIKESAADLLDELDAAGVTTRPFDPIVEARTAEGDVATIPDLGTNAIDAATAWAREQPADLSLAAALVSSGAATNLAAASNDHGDPASAGIAPSAWLRHTLMSAVQPATGATTTEISAQQFVLPDLTASESSLRMILDGTSDWLEALSEDIDAAVDSVVTGIAYDDEHVSIRFDTGESLNVDRVIVTVPIGVLQTDTLQFEPALPLHHQRAISLLGMGTVDTIWLRFKDAFWRTNADILTVVDAPSSVGLWIDIGAHSGEPVLLGILAAAHAERLEALDDDEFLETVLLGLRPYAVAAR